MDPSIHSFKAHLENILNSRLAERLALSRRSDVPQVKFEPSLAPDIERPKPVNLAPEPTFQDPFADYCEPPEEKEVVPFARALESHPLFREPASVNHLTNHLFNSDHSKSEETQTFFQFDRERFSNLPPPKDLRKIQLDRTTSKLVDDGNSAIALNDWLRAFQCFIKALEIDSSCSKAHFGLGLAFAHEVKLDEAIENFKHALKLKPSNRLYREKLRDVLFHQARREKAIGLCGEAIKVDETGPLAEQIKEWYQELVKDARPMSGLSSSIPSESKMPKTKYYPLDLLIHTKIATHVSHGPSRPMDSTSALTPTMHRGPSSDVPPNRRYSFDSSQERPTAYQNRASGPTFSKMKREDRQFNPYHHKSKFNQRK